MLEFIGGYQTSVFLFGDDIVPSPDTITNMLNMFQAEELLPSTFQEITPKGISPQPRLRLNSSNNEWGINFASARIDVEKSPLDDNGKNMGEIDQFTDTAKSYFSRILDHFNKKGYRLSLITSGFTKPLPLEKLDAIFAKLFQPIPFYTETPPFEWISRNAAERIATIDDTGERFYVITTLTRIPLRSTGVRNISERIEIGFDINTAPQNKEPRFTAMSLNDFYTNAINFRGDILNQLKEVFDV